MSRPKREKSPKPSKRRNKIEADDSTEHQKVWPEKVIGGKYVRLLEKQLDALKDEDAHGNQCLFLDDVFVSYLLAFHNPTIRSLRTIEDFSQTVQAQKHLTVPKISKSTLSDFNKLADAARLAPIITALRNQLDRKTRASVDRNEAGLATLLRHTVAVDGTFLDAAADVLWAVANSNNHQVTRYRARVDTKLNVSTWVPEAIVVPEPGESEASSASKSILPGQLYLYDRGFTSYELLLAHYQLTEKEGSKKAEPTELKAHFVIRYKTEGPNSPALASATSRDLTDEDAAAGVTSDRVGYFTGENARRTRASQILLREVVIHSEDEGTKKSIRLITNLMDVSATTIGHLYRYRWQVELFFRWFKSIGHFDHLISHSKDGALTHLYVTLIATLLMYLHTGYRPSKYMFALLWQVAAGAATLEEIMPILRERERQNDLARKSAAARLAKKKAQQQ